MQCIKCGKHINEGSRFCPFCAADQSLATTFRGVTQDVLIGITIDNKYQIVSKLGSGGMGTVYQARRTAIGDTVAVKVLRSDMVADPLAVERFRREAQAAARLKHPNVVAIYDFGVSNQGLVYIVMEMVEGQSLRSMIRQYGSFTASVAFEIINQVCTALGAAHSQGIIHRDLKPDNIIVSETASGWHVKVVDFGIAKLRDQSSTTSSLTQTGMIMGTPRYMSPEQCMGEEIDARSDIYSLGIILYEMLCGVVPFNSPTTSAVIIQQVTQPPPPLRAINAMISPAVESVVYHALEKRPEARPQTAIALGQELSAAVKGVAAAWPATSSAYPPTYSISPQFGSYSPPDAMQTERTATPAGMTPQSGVIISSGGSQATTPRRSRLPIILAVVVLLGLAGGAIAFLMRGRGEGNNTQATANPAQPDKPQPKETPEALKPTPPTVPPPAPHGMVYAPGGEFLMGSDTGSETERPAHKVTAKPYFIDRYEVTCGDYEKFVEATGHPPPQGWTNGHHPRDAERKPVTGITWDDANAYANWAGKRLPTEDEWEFAARGTDGRRFPWGNEWGSGVANADATAHGHHHAANVGAHLKGPSPFGALDMAGNVWEWTASDLTAYPGGQLPAQPPGYKVIRGGSWTCTRDQANTTFRKGYPARGGDYSEVGFRCVKDLPGS